MMGKKTFVIECVVLCLLIATVSAVAYTRAGEEKGSATAGGPAHLQVQERVEVVRGEAVTVPVTLEIRARPVGEVRYSLCRVTGAKQAEESLMPEGLQVGIDPVIFRAEPETAYQAEMNLSACLECEPGTYVLMLDAGIATQWIEVAVV